MKPTVKLAESPTPDGTTLALFEHDGEFFLQEDGVQIQSSFAHSAERALGELAVHPFRPVRQPRILLGGLGLGFSLAAVRSSLLQKRGTFVVAEPVADLPGWHREHLRDLHPGQIDDARVVVRPGSLTAALREKGEGFHAILVDCEGGYAQRELGDRKGLPHRSVLSRLHDGLQEGGLLALRTASAPPFERRLRQAGFDVASEMVPASDKGKQKRRYFIWLARKGRYQSQPRSNTNSNR